MQIRNYADVQAFETEPLAPPALNRGANPPNVIYFTLQ